MIDVKLNTELADYSELHKKELLAELAIPPETGGGYLLSPAAAEELRWCWDHKVARSEYNLMTREVTHYLADGTEIKRGENGDED